MKTIFSGSGESQVIQAQIKTRVYTLQDMAEMFHVTIRTIYNWMDDFRFSYVKIGSKTYITEEQLKEFLDNHQVKSINVNGGKL